MFFIQSGFSQDLESAQWDLKPIIKIGDKIPDQDYIVHSFKKIWMNGSGSLLFWAYVQKKEIPQKRNLGMVDGSKPHILMSFHNNELKSITQEGTKLLVGNNPNPYKIWNRTCGNCMPPHHEVLIIPFEDFFHINIPASNSYGYSKSRTFLWDGNGLKNGIPTLLTAKDGRRLSFATTITFAQGNNYDALVYFITGTKKTKGIAIHNTEPFACNWLIGDTLPGLNGVTIKGFDIPVLYWSVSSIEDDFHPVIWGNDIIVKLSVKGASYKKGLFLLNKEKSFNILAIDGKHPKDEGRTVKDIFWFDGSEDNHLAINILSTDDKKNSREELLLYHNGVFKTIYQGPIQNKKNEVYSDVIRRGGFLPSRPEHYLFFLRQVNKKNDYTSLRPKLSDYLNMEKEIKCDWNLYIYDGIQLKNLTESHPQMRNASKLIPIDMISKGFVLSAISIPSEYKNGYKWLTFISERLPFRLINMKNMGSDMKNIFAGHSENYTLNSGFETLEIAPKNKKSLKTETMFLDSENLEKGLQQVPEFKVDENTSVPLSKVVGWINAKKAIVKLDDGLYTLFNKIAGSK